MNKYQDKAEGMLVGLAVGDALGAPVEFGYSSDFIKKLWEELESFHDTPRCPRGVWTDDTEMALCIADSLLVSKGYDSYDIMQRFTKWVNDGYRTHDNKPAADVGGQTMNAIKEFKIHPTISEKETTHLAGNGAIMRLAPIIIANTFPKKKYPTLKEGYKKGELAVDPKDENGEYIELNDIKPTIDMAVLSCRETHNSIAAELATALFATMLYSALHGLDKNNIAAYCSRWMDPDEDYDQFWIENIDNLVGRALDKDGEKLCDLGGYIVDTFAIALWGLLNYDNFKDGMMAVIRLGGDTDTNAACYGQLAGAYYGYEAIPEEWRKGVYHADELVEIADKLLEMPKCPIIKTRFEDNKYFKEERTK
ncbi:ADP-ribosylglycohydrolase family protein [Candidatus Saccharibacteria bacterium]|nr:ADP-ribosylglycohydrolase family protein [Candidatus Saccharibacteria bacterium]